jgi:hypothetical protein
LNKGAAAEVLFDYHIIERGMMTARPIYDSGYDRIVDSNGRLTRVQIKMTTCKQYGSWIVSTSGSKGRRYKDEFDVLAVYLKQACVWMLIPFEKITSSKMKISLEGKAKKYINNWSIFYEKEDRSETIPVPSAPDCNGRSKKRVCSPAQKVQRGT